MEQLVEAKTSTSTQAPERIRGVGDVVAKVTKAVGIAPCAPCQKRRQWLNKYFPIK
jgi:hypothetical protein